MKSNDDLKFQTLKSRKKKYFLCALVLGVVLLLMLDLTTSKAKYRTTQSIKIVEGTIRNYSPADLNILAIKVQNDSGEYDSSNIVPVSGYTLNETESYCTIPDGNGSNEKDSSITINYHDGVVGFDNMTKKGTKCYLYFDIQLTVNEVILAHKTISTRTDFSTILTTDTTGIIYTAEDDDGTSYYFAGNPTDNWVKFAGFYWRIIRINGDGTIRMIYSGSDESDPITTGDATQIGTSTFNSSSNNNMYVGYMYTSGQVHGTGTASVIKVLLDNWYANNLINYENYIDINAGFCGDRNVATGHSSYPGNGLGQNISVYSPGDRLFFTNSFSFFPRENQNPKLSCNNDFYIVSNSDRGNKALLYPIALITSDELVYGGGLAGTVNQSSYLFTNKTYWTMSPMFYGDNNNAHVLVNNNDGKVDGSRVYNVNGVRPVINLRADVTLTGSGTSTNPFVVS